ncbi:MAG: methyltransferase domain-containing protein [Candidatus Kerfeldbacteria bacterium]|nr:methyltransferase domain-containing protein [Candidatus Kerfeldbacteria bacterium]
MTFTTMLYDKPIGLFDLRISPLPVGGSVLDIGFGFGDTIINFSKAGFTTYALDNSQELLDGLTSRVAKENVKMTILKAEATNIPLPDNTLDLVILTEVLEHVVPYEQLVDEIRRVLKPGGYLILSVPTYSTEKIYTFLNKDYPKNATHVNLFKKSYLKSMFAAHQFQVVKVKNENFRPALYWVFNAAAHAQHNYVGATQSTSRLARGFDRFYDWLNSIRIGYYISEIGRYFFAKSQYYYLRK